MEKTNGELSISNNAIISIVKHAIKEIDGVIKLGDKENQLISSLFSKKKRGNNIVIENVEEGIVLDIDLIVKYGVCVPDLVLKVQEKIINTMREMLEIKASQVNINIVGIEVVEKCQEEI